MLSLHNRSTSSTSDLSQHHLPGVVVGHYLTTRHNFLSGVHAYLPDKSLNFTPVTNMPALTGAVWPACSLLRPRSTRLSSRRCINIVSTSSTLIHCWYKAVSSVGRLGVKPRWDAVSQLLIQVLNCIQNSTVQILLKPVKNGGGFPKKINFDIVTKQLESVDF